MNARVLRSVFHPTDFYGGDEAAFEHALQIALAARGDLDLFHVDSPKEEFDWSLFPSVRSTLERWGHLPPGTHHPDIAALGLNVRKIHHPAAPVLATLQSHLAANTPDLVVLATHQRSGLDRWLHHALSEPVARTTTAPTLFVPRRVQGFVSPETGRVRIRTVLIPIDHSPNAQPAVDMTAALLRTLGVVDAHFLLLHVGPEGGAPRLLVSDESGWTHETETWEGPVVDHILACAEANDADLVVMAKRGQRTPLDALRGSTTERIVRGARCPVLVVPVPAQ